MNEYQYYEFRAVDRPLTAQEQAELRKLSTRATISAYHFSNVYRWGRFKGSSEAMVERYFDAHLYVAHWGVRRLMLRLPERHFDMQRASSYLEGDRPLLRRAGDHVILRFEIDETWSDDVQGEGWLTSLLPLRQELLSGDLRSLYLGWLARAALGQLSADDEEPPVPPGLRSLSTALTALVDFLLIPPELLEVAARASAAAEEPVPREQLETWLQGLPAPEKDALLLRLIDQSGAVPGLALHRCFQAGQAPAPEQLPPPRRMVGTLLRDAVALQRDKERQAKERQAAARERELEALTARGSAAWEQVDQLFATRRPTDHAAGVRLLVDLREIARRQGTEEEFTRRLSQLRERNARRAGLISRMDKEGLSAP
jgi:hypothetical protein